MKKKVKIGLFVFIIIGVVILNITYKNKNEVTKTKWKRQENLAIVVKDANGVETSSDSIPIGNYKINEEKTHCENNGKILSYDNTTGKIGFSFIGSDKCYLYFDVIYDTEKPVISNLIVNDTTITATLTDNESLSGYGISTSNSTEPTSWTTISGTTYNLSTTITTEGTYYLWVKDGAGNKVVSDVIDLVAKGWKTILANNTLNETIPDFSTVATTNEGLYAADDDYTATTGMKSYYFRGAVDNNWVKFGKVGGQDIYWRIIRVNGDGSIRMIYSGTTAPTESTKVVMTGTGTQISTGAFNSTYNNPSLVGYMYTSVQQHGNSTSSTIKGTLENWYKTTTLEKNTAIKSLVSQDQIFCNDRSVTTEQWSSESIYYEIYTRLYTDKKPILTCPTDSDKFTLKTSSIGNKILDCPVGLITADEIVMAGGAYGKSDPFSSGGAGSLNNSSYYLYTNQAYWFGSPNYFEGNYSPNHAYVFSISAQGTIGSSPVLSTLGIRPVISLSKNVKLSGDGTWNNVYEVVN